MRLDIDLTVKDDGGSQQIKSFTANLKNLDENADKTNKTFTNMTGIFQKMTGHLFSLKGLIGAVVGGLTVRELKNAAINWVNIAAAQDKAEVSFKQAAITVGKYSKEFFDAAVKNAEALQRLTGAGDEAILEGQKFLITYKQISNDLLPRATRAMLDYAQFTGKAVPESAKAIGKASMGMTGELRRVGIQIDENVYKTEGFIGVLKQLEAQIGGQAEAFRTSIEGQWVAYKNAVDEAKEALGGIASSIFRNTGLLEGLIGIVEKATVSLENFKKNGDLGKWSKAMAEVVVSSFTAISYVLQGAGDVFLWLLRIITRLKKAFEEFGVAVMRTGNQIQEWRRSLALGATKEKFGMLSGLIGKLWSPEEEKSYQENKRKLEEQIKTYEKWVGVEKDLAGAQKTFNSVFSQARELLRAINLEYKDEEKVIKEIKAQQKAMLPAIEKQEDVIKKTAKEHKKIAPLIKEQKDNMKEITNLMTEAAHESEESWLNAFKTIFTEGKNGFEVFARSVFRIFQSWGDVILTQVLKPIASYISNLFVTQYSIGQINPLTGIPAITAIPKTGAMAGAVPYMGAAAMGGAAGYAMNGKAGAIGGAAGAGIGMAVGGPVGALVGGTLGSLAGGLFDKGKKKSGGTSLKNQIKDSVIGGIAEAFEESQNMGEFKDFAASLEDNLFASVKSGISRAFGAEMYKMALGPDLMRAFTGMNKIISSRGKKGGNLEDIMDLFATGFDQFETSIKEMEPIWKLVTERLKGLENSLNANTASLEARTEIENLLRDFQFSALAPVQSREAYELEYQRLLAQAQKTPGTTGELTSFIKGQYLPFYQGYGGNYADIIEMIRSDLTSLPWYESKQNINIVLQVDGRVIGNIVAEQVNSNANLQVALKGL